MLVDSDGFVAADDHLGDRDGLVAAGDLLEEFPEDPPPLLPPPLELPAVPSGASVSSSAGACESALASAPSSSAGASESALALVPSSSAGASESALALVPCAASSIGCASAPTHVGGRARFAAWIRSLPMDSLAEASSSPRQWVAAARRWQLSERPALKAGRAAEAERQKGEARTFEVGATA